MKRSTFCLAMFLACSSVSSVASIGAAGLNYNFDQQTVERPRRVEMPSRGFLGVELREVNSEVVQRLKLQTERGALVEGVTSGSSAAQAGLQKDDVIVKWDGEPIESALELSRHIRETPAGRNVRLGVLRAGREIEVNVKMGERSSIRTSVRAIRPTPVARVRVRPEVARVRARDTVRLGAQLQSMTPQLAEYFGLSKRSGALVVFVFADSPAAKAGLKAGDVILSMAGETVENPMDVRRILSTKSEGSIELKLLRDKREQTLSVHVEKGTSSWLLEPEDSDEVVAVSTPIVVDLPKIHISPAEVSVPSIHVTPTAVSVPSIHVTPTAVSVPSIKLDPMKIQTPKVHITPSSMKIDLEPVKIEIPKVVLEPMKIEIPKVDMEPMKIEIPKIDLAPVRVLVLPRRIIV